MNEQIKVTVVGTGSSGNAYLVEWQNMKFLLDAGISGNNIRKANGYKLSDISAAFITHEHKDHAGFVLDLIGFGVSIFLPKDCNVFIPDKYKNSIKYIEESVGWNNLYGTPLRYRANWQKHDAPCFGYEFLMNNTTLHYVTDTAEIQAADFQQLGKHYWICECNYSNALMAHNDETLSAEIAQRNMRTRDSHLSDDYVIKFFKGLDDTAILFVHHSELNFDIKDFRRKARGLKYQIAQNGKSYIFQNGKITENKENRV